MNNLMIKLFCEPGIQRPFKYQLSLILSILFFSFYSCSCKENAKTSTLTCGNINTTLYGLDFATGQIFEDNTGHDGCLYYNTSNPWPILTVAGGEGVMDVGVVNDLCEVTTKSGSFGPVPVSAAGHGYVVHLNSTNKYARVFCESIVGDNITIKWEYPF
jgi:hypothetical protein